MATTNSKHQEIIYINRSRLTMRGDISILATRITELFSTKPRQARTLKDTQTVSHQDRAQLYLPVQEVNRLGLT